MATQRPSQQPAVFLDRDDTLIATTAASPTGDLGDPALVSLLPHAKQLCDALKAARFSLVVVTNQAGVARGRYAEQAVHAVHERLNDLLGGSIDAFRYCPFHPEADVERYRHPDHPWRKPRPGMLLDAAEQLCLDLRRSWIVGDAERDCQAGLAAGCRAILIGKGHAGGQKGGKGWYTALDLEEAGQIILDGQSSPPTGPQETRA